MHTVREGEQGREQRADMEEGKDRNNSMKVRFRKWMGMLKKRVSIQQERGFLAFYPFHSDSPDPKLDLLSYFRISFILKWERTQEIAFHTAISHFSVNRNWSFDPHYGAFWRRRVQILKLPPSLALSHNRFVGPSSPPARPPFPLPEKVSPLPSCVPLPSPCSSRQPAAATRLPAINHVRSSSSPSSSACSVVCPQSCYNCLLTQPHGRRLLLLLLHLLLGRT